jgi:hypothetical protein
MVDSDGNPSFNTFGGKSQKSAISFDPGICKVKFYLELI